MKKGNLTILICLLSVCAEAQSSREWGSYFGGGAIDLPYDITTDPTGNVILTGQTESPTGIAYQGFQQSYGGQKDAFLVKADAMGNIMWGTYFGGMMAESGTGVATDASGNIYMAGNTRSTSGIATPGAYLDTITNPFTNYGFLARFDAGGNRVWATYFLVLGINDVACDLDGNIYITGIADASSQIPPGGFQPASGGGADGFIAKFSPSGALIWATYYGGSAADYFKQVAVDVSGNVYAAGTTQSANAIASGGFQNTYGGIEDAVVVKFDANGNRLWASYYGGADYEMANSVASDELGNVYIAGSTSSTSGIAAGGFQNAMTSTNNYYHDCFLAKFDAAGNRLWATYYGGNSMDHMGNVDVDKNNHAYLSGATRSAGGIASGGYENNLVGISNTFVAEFDPAGNRLCATYYCNDLNGIGFNGAGVSLVTDNFGNVFHCGNTNDTAGIAAGGFQNTFGGGVWDVFVVKFKSCSSTAVAEQEYQPGLLQLFPNPAADAFTVKTTEAGEIRMYNVQGKLVDQRILSAGETVLDLTETAAGLYTLQFISPKGYSIQKLIRK